MNKHLFFFYILSAIIMIGCNEEGTILDINAIDPIWVPYCNPEDGGDLNNWGYISLRVNKQWSARSDQPWCIISPSSGDGEIDHWPSITLFFDKNTCYEKRSGTITVVSEEKTATIEFIQLAAPYLALSQQEYIITCEAQQVIINVETNLLEEYQLNVRSSANWAKYVSTKGISTLGIVVDVTKNQTRFTRECEIEIRQSGGISPLAVLAKIKQNGQQ